MRVGKALLILTIFTTLTAFSFERSTEPVYHVKVTFDTGRTWTAVPVPMRILTPVFRSVVKEGTPAWISITVTYPDGSKPDEYYNIVAEAVSQQKGEVKK